MLNLASHNLSEILSNCLNGQFLFFFYKYAIFEVFCLQNSLIVGMQPQVSGKDGSLVGWLVGWVDHVRDFQRLSNIPKELNVGGGGGTKMLHDQ